MTGYDDLASEYDAQTDDNPWNAWYERPALRALLPDVAASRVLDAGCSGGAHAAWLVEHGAAVVGVDLSPPMVELARQRVPTADTTSPISAHRSASPPTRSSTSSSAR